MFRCSNNHGRETQKQIEGVTFGYDASNPLFSNVHFGVDLDSRVGIVGPNGAGKSTLLNLILDKLRPLSGEVRRNANLRIAHFTQHAAEQFDYRLNSVDNMIKLFPGVQEQVCLTYACVSGWEGAQGEDSFKLTWRCIAAASFGLRKKH